MHSKPDPSTGHDTPRRGAQTIGRAIGLLRDVARHNERGARLSELSRDAGLNLSTTHRLLAVLAAEGLITHDASSKRYHLGIELYHLGSAAYQYTVRERFRATLEKIAHETGDTVFLLIRSGDDALCIDRVEGSYPDKDRSRGHRQPPSPSESVCGEPFPHRLSARRRLRGCDYRKRRALQALQESHPRKHKGARKEGQAAGLCG